MLSEIAEAVSDVACEVAQCRRTLSSFLPGILTAAPCSKISRVLGVHEATISRRIQRITADLHRELVKNLQSKGMSQGRRRKKPWVSIRVTSTSI